MLEVKDLRKDYAGFQAVNGISFSLKPGDILGFIGANGAGKTTTIRMLATLLEPSSGTATIDGFDIVKHPMDVRQRIGYMPDFFGLYDDVKVWEYLDFFATIHQIPTRGRPAVIKQALELTDLTIKRDAYVQTLSRGMQQRLCLAKCLVHDPSLLLLDEPASGLDPRARAELKELILELGRMGKILIISSHILPELSDFCNTVAIIERGNMVAFGPVSTLLQQVRQSREIRVRVLDRVAATHAALDGLPGVIESTVQSETELRISFDGDDHAQANVLKTLIEKGLPVISFQEAEADLQDVFLQLTTGAVN